MLTSKRNNFSLVKMGNHTVVFHDEQVYEIFSKAELSLALRVAIVTVLQTATQVKRFLGHFF